MKQPDTTTPDQPVTGAPEPSTKVYRDADGHECSLLELCRKEPEWAANVIATLEARWEKYTEPGIVHPLRAPKRIWVQWMPRLRTPMVYMNLPAIVDGTLGWYVLANELLRPSVRSPVCLDCGHPLKEADYGAPACPYCGCP